MRIYMIQPYEHHRHGGIAKYFAGKFYEVPEDLGALVCDGVQAVEANDDNTVDGGTPETPVVTVAPRKAGRAQTRSPHVADAERNEGIAAEPSPRVTTTERPEGATAKPSAKVAPTARDKGAVAKRSPHVPADITPDFEAPEFEPPDRPFEFPEEIEFD